jgi:hypothetical protein
MAYPRSTEISWDRLSDIFANVALYIGVSFVVGMMAAFCYATIGQDATEFLGALTAILCVGLICIAIGCTIATCCTGTDEDRDEIGRAVMDAYVTFQIVDAIFGDDD